MAAKFCQHVNFEIGTIESDYHDTGRQPIAPLQGGRTDTRPVTSLLGSEYKHGDTQDPIAV